MNTRSLPDGSGDPHGVPTERCDVCIVGAGIAGLNALFVASRYLSSDQRVILVDRRDRVGGMWLDTYDYVRLHQPHPFFTAGNVEWTLGRRPGHLATKDEVLDHMQHCLDVIKQRVHVVELYGWDLEDDRETDGTVQVSCRSSDGRTIQIEAGRLIKAYGWGVTPNDPLELSSSRVRSVSPDHCDLRAGQMRDGDGPVWVIGGSKTGMDTAHTLITEYPGREINLVAGSGTFFASRDRIFPAGRRRWFGSEPFSSILTEVVRRFDGANETDVIDWLRATYGTWLTPSTGNFFLGFLSEEETDTIAAGLHEVVMDHLVDVIDHDDSTEMVLRSGTTRPLEPGSWVVNCTGYLTGYGHPYEPYTSGSGNVLSVQMRSAVQPQTTYNAYFLSHLMFLGKLTEVPLYEMDLRGLQERSSLQTAALASVPLSIYNLSLILDSVPKRALMALLNDNGLDLDRWFPIPHRLRATARFLRDHRSLREEAKQTLDTIAERFDVRCGPLVTTSPRIGGPRD
jgi:hypothetical protein